MQSLLATLKCARADCDFFENIDSDARSLCAKCKIDFTVQHRRARRMPGRRICWASYCYIDTLEAFRLHVYLPVNDSVIGELARLFSHSSITVLLSVQALTPKHSSFLEKEKLEASQYRGNFEGIGHETIIATHRTII